MATRVLPIVGMVVLGACVNPQQHHQTAQQHKQDVQQTRGDRVTVGTVQGEIREGMSSAEVTEVLGSPNVINTDQKGREVWVYDKVSTTRVSSQSQGGTSSLVFGSVGVAGGASAQASASQTAAETTSQRTLTVIIKYNERGKVRDFSYRTTRF